jgi:hypothetical protein
MRYSCMLVLLILAAPLSAQTRPGKAPDASKLPESAQPIYFSAAHATDWLKLTNRADGRFVHGFNPALRLIVNDGDNFLSQAGATMALARASRYFRDERGTAIARQAALSLLQLDTVLEEDKTTRVPASPSAAVNRLAANGVLLCAIHEIATPGKDLLDQGDQLGNYLRKQQRPDGSLAVAPGAIVLVSGSEDGDTVHAGWALRGIIRSQHQRPAEWKLDLIRKARGHYHNVWHAKKNIAMVCTHTPAYAEAYRLTKDAAYADTVFAMNDWLVAQQYREEFDGGRKHWTGGFPRQAGAKDPAAPDVWSAIPGQSLADACRVAKLAGDLPRLQRYEKALLQNCYFLMSLQYGPEKASHYVEGFRPKILGAFHASHQDGNLKIDYTQHALCAMVQYLDAVVE